MIRSELFEKIYQRPPSFEAFCPYRVCPIGAHIDHQKGRVTGLAINKGIHISYGKKMNGVVELVSLQFGKRAQWHVNCTPADKQGDWADYLRGATIALDLKPGEEPNASFDLGDDKAVAVYAYCNLHGLWKTEV